MHADALPRDGRQGRTGQPGRWIGHRIRCPRGRYARLLRDRTGRGPSGGGRSGHRQYRERQFVGHFPLLALAEAFGRDTVDGRSGLPPLLAGHTPPVRQQPEGVCRRPGQRVAPGSVGGQGVPAEVPYPGPQQRLHPGGRVVGPHAQTRGDGHPDQALGPQCAQAGQTGPAQRPQFRRQPLGTGQRHQGPATGGPRRAGAPRPGCSGCFRGFGPEGRRGGRGVRHLLAHGRHDMPARGRAGGRLGNLGRPSAGPWRRRRRASPPHGLRPANRKRLLRPPPGAAATASVLPAAVRFPLLLTDTVTDTGRPVT